MSKFVNEILKDLKENPEEFKDFHGQGVRKNNIIIMGYGNTRLLSITAVHINSKHIPTTYIDNWKLEVAIKNWYKTVSLKTLLV